MTQFHDLVELTDLDRDHHELLTWLDTTDYFTAPASTTHHGAYAGGLLVHSVNVARVAEHLAWLADPGDKELRASAVLCGLVHDVCKLDAYRTDENGYIVWNESHDPRHGDLSRELVCAHTHLTPDESDAIEWHMGLWDQRLRITESTSVSDALRAIRARERFLAAARTPLVNALVSADYEATWFLDDNLDCCARF